MDEENGFRVADHLEQQPHERWSVDDEAEAERIAAEPELSDEELEMEVIEAMNDRTDEELEDEIVDAITAKEIKEAEAGLHRDAEEEPGAP